MWGWPQTTVWHSGSPFKRSYVPHKHPARRHDGRPQLLSRARGRALGAGRARSAIASVLRYAGETEQVTVICVLKVVRKIYAVDGGNNAKNEGRHSCTTDDVDGMDATKRAPKTRRVEQ